MCNFPLVVFAAFLAFTSIAHLEASPQSDLPNSSRNRLEERCGKVAKVLDPYNYKELVTRKITPKAVTRNVVGHKLIDFSLDAIGWLELDGVSSGTYEIVVGELIDEKGSVKNAYPKSTIRCFRIKGHKPSGLHRVPFPPDRVNLKGYNPKAPAIRLPKKFGVVAPFRYVEVISGPEMDFRQVAVNYPIDMSKSSFTCDNHDLVRVYDMCKYSILATSFCGVYVDGDRERTPYEADAYINQLCHYAIDDDGSLARKSHEWLMDHPTWPTEWRQHSIMMAWADWMWTGDKRSLMKYYDKLKNDKLLACYARSIDGLLETGGERGKGAKIGVADIVDWPKNERDGFDFRPVNAVVNAFYYRNLREMADIASALGKDDDAKAFAKSSADIYEAYQKVFYDTDTGLYVDGEGSSHSSLHSNVAALAFGLVPQDMAPKVLDFIESKGMVCSVYFAQYYLDALFKYGRDEAAVKLMTAKGERSWIGMLEFGSTVSMEAWNIKAKPNLDLNHAWGAAPLNIISRHVLGVTPLEGGFKRIRICPQLGTLRYIKGTVPTVAGPVTVAVDTKALTVDTPSPAEVVFDGRAYNVLPGRHVFSRITNVNE